MFIGQKGDALADIPGAHPAIDEVYYVRAGKFRRYHGSGLVQLLDVKTLLKNIRDFFYVIIGYFQSRKLLKKLRPSIIFVRGGFVGVPVGLAAARNHIPYITHDSDALASLANRLIAKHAVLHAVSAPPENYQYPKEKVIEVGVPVDANYKTVSDSDKQAFRRLLGVEQDAPVILLTGGGNGAQPLNKALVAVSAELFKTHPNLVLLHLAGRGKEAEIRELYIKQLNPEQLKRVILKDFVSNLYAYSGAADIIICRAGATNLAEFALQARACVVVPNPLLTGGHQLKNSQYLANAGAIQVVEQDELDKNPEMLLTTLRELLNSPDKRQVLSRAFLEFARPDVAAKIAALILNQANHNSPT